MHRVARPVKVLSAFRRFGTKASNGLNGGSKSPTEVPLSEPLPGFPTPIFANVSEKAQQETRVTMLDNGIRVASQPKFGQFATVGIVVDSGSRYEVSYPSGISHFLEKLAFQSTTEFDNRDTIMQYLEKYGGICDCQISRDSAVYAASIETEGSDAVVKLLNEVSRRVTISEGELAGARQAIGFDLEDLNIRHEQEPILTEMIHAAAYRQNTLGLPRLCPPENIAKIDRPLLFTFLSQYYQPSRIVVAGVGVEHDALVKSTEKHFSDKAIWEEDSSLVLPAASKATPDNSTAQYTGGDRRVEKDLSNISMGPTPIPELAHFVLGFESCSHHDEDFIAFCVLNILMGGGGSFSAGGPGKGMYTRLYTNVLNVYHWMYNATAFNHSYSDTGLFCIQASSPPEQASKMVDVLIREFKNMTGPIEKVELDRAKKQLSSMLMMNLESRPVIFEDVARQVLAYGHRKTATQLLEDINNVKEEDLRRVATKMLLSKPSVACLGKLEVFPTYAEIERDLASSVISEKKQRRKLLTFL
ncbi:hypothetical protein RvY_08373 [Ramazzottius varieornatus]|uniref:Mitochondrial-processing peptidase subunit alpha n=1 Tax=Ramazzottius varieornatus TaxID=947166 RepID=A0A1D1V5K3_RAMVA|nr:hypothetical protein RvY_08373 [Ramazzottius varieornatus]